MEKLVGVKEVAAQFGMSVRGVWRKVANGEFPQPVKLGKLSRWCESELDVVFDKLKRKRQSLVGN